MVEPWNQGTAQPRPDRDEEAPVTVTTRAMTPQELLDIERKTEASLRSALLDYIDVPSASRQEVLEFWTKEYRDAWSHGRRRVL